ncbi:PaaI family thioesterase [Bradyrhizobium sp. AS23.2]|uniref:PaaI family thioesterase n=1 Tax=Bradyrhizobium sp. AS23.2 TaxID=1680155 RepID=UPI000939A7B0|nr:PaaI family thioesterase [Bradyrhizobium sp. AS23.2]OKO81074.1 hypothetical protein AC630_14740 [Bradyrhizobium sp. AS23.2]
MREQVDRNAYISKRGIKLLYQDRGQSFMTMRWQPANGTADGQAHEGALTSLLDTAGAMASWSVTGVGPFKASTPSLQVQFFGPVPAMDLEACAQVIYQDQEMFWVDVEVSDTQTQHVHAKGAVTFRIVV